MNTANYSIEIITPCFCSGAKAEQQAEIRAPSIRGQLRWWFRTLGGFKSLAAQGKTLRQQENEIFGNAAGNSGTASRVVVRVAGNPSASLRSQTTKDSDLMDARMGSDRGYLLFPLRNKPRGVFDGSTPARFQLSVQWRGSSEQWIDIQSLVTVFGHLGSLGFRSRRAMGALAFEIGAYDLASALGRFTTSNRLILRQLPADNSRNAISVLARWLKGWRAHGRTADHQHAHAPEPPHNPGFRFARNDHDAGFNRDVSETYRPALGLPIIQRYATGNPSNWDFGSGSPRQPKGRFASPVLLRPHRDAQGKWHSLVIFADAHKWPDSHQVYLNGQPRAVSLALYEAMKNDPGLKPFP